MSVARPTDDTAPREAMPSAAEQHGASSREPDKATTMPLRSTPEAALSMNAMRCAEIASGAAPKQGMTPYQQEFARRVESATHIVRKLVDTAHNAMGEQLYTQSGLHELVGSVGELLEKVATQNKSKPGHKTRKPNPFPNPEIVVVDTSAKLSSMIDKVCSLDHSRKSPHLSIDIEGAKFHRDGDISIIQVSSQELDAVYLVDVDTLGEAAFDTTGVLNPECSLRVILESPSIPKLMFDCRTDNDVLLHIAGVRLEGVVDLQLLFLATRTHPKDRRKVPSLTKVIGYAAGLHGPDKQRWNYDKHWGKSAMMIGPEETLELIEKFDGDWSKAECSKVTGLEGYEWVSQRPISELVQKYCVADVLMLPAVYEYCITHRYWNEKWSERVEEEMKWRLAMADAKVFEHRLAVMQAAPPGWDKIEQVARAEASGVEVEEGSRES